MSFQKYLVRVLEKLPGMEPRRWSSGKEDHAGTKHGKKHETKESSAFNHETSPAPTHWARFVWLPQPACSTIHRYTGVVVTKVKKIYENMIMFYETSLIFSRYLNLSINFVHSWKLGSYLLNTQFNKEIMNIQFIYKDNKINYELSWNNETRRPIF